MSLVCTIRKGDGFLSLWFWEVRSPLGDPDPRTGLYPPSAFWDGCTFTRRGARRAARRAVRRSAKSSSRTETFTL